MRVSGVYSIVFTVTNSQGQSASVTRTLVVQVNCLPPEQLCPDKAGPFLPFAIAYSVRINQHVMFGLECLACIPLTCSHHSHS